LIFNADEGSNYTNRQSTNGGSDGQRQANDIRIGGSGGSGARGNLNYAYFTNLADREKIGTIHGLFGTTGTGSGQNRTENVAKWTRTSGSGTGDASAQITKVRLDHENKTFNTNHSELVVLGYDPADTATGEGFWKELASVAGAGSSTTLTTPTFAAKKYLRFTIYTTAFTNGRMTFNGDTGSNYTSRYTGNGSGNAAATGQTGLELLYASAPASIEGIMLNDASLEKTGVVHTAERNTAGAGAALNRQERIIKWIRTSGTGTGDAASQITRVELNKTGTNFGTNETLKVWGSD